MCAAPDAAPFAFGMLKRLTVRNLAVVEEAEVEFDSGLNVITGETGAGKTVLMGALELVLGGRADASVVREGAKEAEVEACFDDRTVRRTVSAQGRSRAWIDDESVSVAELREFGAHRVDVHGPTANQNMLEEGFQREVLDSFGSVGLEAYAKEYARLAELRSHLAGLRRDGADDEIDMLRFQVEEIGNAALSVDDETIAERQTAAAHAEELVECANAITEALGGDGSAAEMLARAASEMHRAARHFPSAAEWAARAEEISDRVQELSREVAAAASGIDAETDIAALDARLAVVNRLKRKYGPTLADVLEKFEAKKTRLGELERLDEAVAETEREMAAADSAVRKEGAKLTALRRTAAYRLSKKVTAALRELGFQNAKLRVDLGATEPEAHGMDSVSFMFEPNPGEPARPLADIASSGEIARVMLAVKGVLAGRCSAQTLVFDEIDANIGGEVGRIVGERLGALSAGRQVIAITHLPQSAVFGKRHLVVEKSVSGGRTRTSVAPVEGERRVAEIARMLGGEKLTSVVKRHAQELLQLSY